MIEPASDLEPLDTALLIVDVQEGFINDSTKYVIRAVEELQSRYEHIFATRFINGVDSPHRNLIDWHRFGEGSRDTELAFCLSPKAEIIDKTTYTCVKPRFLGQPSQPGNQRGARMRHRHRRVRDEMRSGPVRERNPTGGAVQSIRQPRRRRAPSSRPAHSPSPNRSPPNPMTVRNAPATRGAMSPVTLNLWYSGFTGSEKPAPDKGVLNVIDTERADKSPRNQKAVRGVA